jgi:hypothetical protein
MGILDTGYFINPNGSVPFQQSFAGMGDFSGIANKDALDFVNANPNAGTAVGLPATGPSWWDSFGGYTTTDGTKVNGWGGAALGLAQGLSGAYMGMKQYGLAKSQLAFSKDAFNKNYAANKATVNASMEDRQRARVASNAGAYQSVGDYMAKNGIQ